MDIGSGKVTDFQTEEVERLRKMVAAELGDQLSGHRLELNAV